MVGDGSAGCGICAQLAAAMVQEGLTEQEAADRVWMVGPRGLLLDRVRELTAEQRPWAKPRADLAAWQGYWEGEIALAEVIKQVRPTILIGTSGTPGLFTEAVVREMARHVPRPIILPLSNPTSRAEATPADLIAWTEGRALVATGSPFPVVSYEGRTVPIAQCNNVYIFPGLGLGVLAAGARRVTDAMLMAAARALAECSPARADPRAALLPAAEDIGQVSRRIALAVGAKAQEQGVAPPTSPAELERRVAAHWWEPRYPRLVRKGPQPG
jgi:malate dehydrogenase (oxaloacetate-decarboxylating)